MPRTAHLAVTLLHPVAAATFTEPFALGDGLGRAGDSKEPQRRLASEYRQDPGDAVAPRARQRAGPSGLGPRGHVGPWGIDKHLVPGAAAIAQLQEVIPVPEIPVFKENSPVPILICNPILKRWKLN